MSIADEIKQSFRTGDMLVKLIYVNFAIFVVIGLTYVVFRLATPGVSLDQLQAAYFNKVLSYLMVPNVFHDLVRRPWTLITYMFTHFNFLHILFNMLTLYWFGRIFLKYLTEKQLFSTYISGGIAGAVLSILFINFIPGLQEYLGSPMLGASAAIMAIVIAIAFYVPDYTLNLMFIGPVKLKYIALFFIIIDVLMMASYNAGGHIAHLGGALYGYYYIRRYKKGKDAGRWLNKFLDGMISLFKPRPRLNVSYRSNARNMTDEDYNKQKTEQQHEIDRILDKIAQSGYESLTKKEKEMLFKMGDKDQ